MILDEAEFADQDRLDKPTNLALVLLSRTIRIHLAQLACSSHANAVIGAHERVAAHVCAMCSSSRVALNDRALVLVLHVEIAAMAHEHGGVRVRVANGGPLVHAEALGVAGVHFGRVVGAEELAETREAKGRSRKVRKASLNRCVFLYVNVTKFRNLTLKQRIRIKV